QVEQTVKHLVNKKALFSIRATITNYNVSLSKLVNYFADLGVKFLHFEKVVIAGRATNKFIPDTEKYIEEFKKALKLASQKKIYLITSPLMNLFFPSDHFCVQLTGEKYIFTPQGKIILCYFKEMEKFVKIGKIINDKLIINKKKKQKMLNLSLPDDCEDCAFKFICSGGCPADNLLATGSFKKVDKELCKINKAILHETIIFLYEKGRTQKFLPVIGNEILERLRDNY
ncbi:SPASM domain-containing protein, partial [Patescibacteria group bacterium]|nr:SPASM domain-containing protein [Patescibacteria group bacterium]